MATDLATSLDRARRDRITLAVPQPIPIAALIERTARHIADCLRGSYLAILLVGAAARGEISIDSDRALLSDLDFLVVLPQRSAMTALLAERRCRRRLRALDAVFAQEAPGKVSIGFASAVPRLWTLATPLMWELRAHARVLYGASEVRGWPAMRRADQIPQWEGIRLVANRMCELLGAIGDLGDPPAIEVAEPATRGLRYACVKLALACSEAQLIDTQNYRATYRERQGRHSQVAARFSDSQNELIAAAYRAKLGGDERSLMPDTFMLIARTLELAVATLDRFGLRRPDDLAERARTESPAVPGLATDLAFFVVQRLTGNRVSPRRAVAAVYAQALGLALAIADDMRRLRHDPRIGGACRALARAYKAAPQLVGVVRARGRA